MALTQKEREDVILKASNIIFDNEGKYGSINKNDNGSLSVGKLQWHGDRALDILKLIVNADKVEAKSILGDKLCSEILNVDNWGSRIATEDEAGKLSKLLTTDQGKKIQDTTAGASVSAYIKHGEGLKIDDPGALIMHADCYNQRPASAKSIIKRAITKAGEASKVTLDIYYQCAITDSVLGSSKHKPRRDKVFKKIIALYASKPQPAPEPKPAPKPEPKPTPKPKQISYRVVKGDNLTKIVAYVKVKYGISTTVAKIVKDNKIKNPNLIRIGQVLTIK
jgi:hypothetical protein